MKTIFTLLIACCFTWSSFGQFFDAPDRIEKSYVHTDRSFYFPGETIWFKAYITNAHEQITLLSKGLFVELLGPKGSTLKKLHLEIKDGYAYGQFDIDKEWVGGIYKIKAHTSWMKNLGEEAFFTKKITVQKVVIPKLQLKFDFDKEAYGPSSKVTAKLNIKDLENTPFENVRCPFTIAVNGEIIQSKNAITNSNGDLEIAFDLPADLSTSDVLLNIKIPFEGSFEAISRSVPITLDNIDLQFLAEGGQALEGITNTIAFKAINNFGKPADISGIIKNNKGQEIGSFKSFHNGMGSFQLTPKKGESYSAYIQKPFVSKVNYPITGISDSGVSVQLVSNDTANTIFHISSSQDRDITILGLDSQKEVYRKNLRLTKNIKTVSIPNAQFPKGIINFKIEDLEKNPLAERLVFMHYDKKLDIEIETDKGVYNLRDSILVTVKTSFENEPIPANLSLAIADNKVISFADDRQDNIDSYFYMSSELQGTIYKPKFYFNPKEDKAQKALDFVLLTHGWRSYMTQNISGILDAKYAPEISGIHKITVTDTANNPVKANLLLLRSHPYKAWPLKTNDQGQAQIRLTSYNGYSILAYTDDFIPLLIENSTALEKQKIKSTKSLTKDKYLDGKARLILAERNKGHIDKKPKKNRVLPIPGKKTATNIMLDEGASLDEVIVTASGIRRSRKAMGYSTISVNDYDIEVRTSSSISRALQGRTSGVQITNTSGPSGAGSNVVIRGYASISGNNQSLIVINGVPYDNINNTTDYGLSIDDIQSIAVLKGAAAISLFGPKGNKGVILITTKSNRYSTYGMKSFSIPVKRENYAIRELKNNNKVYHDRGRDFYTPLYDTNRIPEQRDDFRNTIYWNPVVQTDSMGIATIKAYSSDAVTSFKVTAEGVDVNGQVGRQELDINTFKRLNLDMKIPPFLSVNDTVQLPITIRNKENIDRIAILSIGLPKNIESTSKTKDISIPLPANESSIYYLPIVPIETAQSSRITVSVKAGDAKDSMSKEVSIVSPLFPNEASVSNQTSERYTVDIGQPVPGSLDASITIYTDVIAEVFDGIEGIVRKPYGCFEQASAAVYPNVMVMQYLRDANINNPEAEQKAMKYIRQGYRKLNNYEVRTGGFSWFGNPPADDGLSAFGVLEFTDMKKVHPRVSEKLINRTADWLLEHKDGKGGWYNNHGHSGFSRVSQDLTNAYIVYTLTEAGKGSLIIPEFKNAVQKALESKDTYRLALMANTSARMKDETRLENTLNALKANLRSFAFSELPVTETITKSYGKDKITETIALSLLALLNEKNADQELLLKAAIYLKKQRKYGRFGSTQATVLSLKALIAFAKAQKEIIKENEKITLKVNDSLVFNFDIYNDKSGKIEIDVNPKHFSNGENTIAISYGNQKTVLPYTLNMSWNTYKPLDSTEKELKITTTMPFKGANIGDNIRMDIEVENRSNRPTGMVTAVIGIPAGASVQPWQLKKLIEEREIAFYEIQQNYLIVYWNRLNRFEKKELALDLKAEVPGTYIAPASSVYLYYGEETKHWIPGSTVTIDKN